MANALYDDFKEFILTQSTSVDWDTDDIRCLLIRTSGGGAGPYYTFSSAHNYLDDVPNNSDCRPATAVATANPTATDGVADCDDVTFSSVASGDAIQAIILYKHTGVESTSALIAYFDTGTGLPVTPNGGDITIQWDDGANKIFAL